MTGIRVELQLKDGSFTTGMLRAGQSVSSFRKELARVDPHFRKLASGGDKVVTSVRKADVVSRDFLSTLRDVSIVTGAVTMAFRGLTGASNGIIGSVTRVNAEIERLKYQMLGMSVSAEPMREAAASVEYLRQKALQVPFSLNELATSFVKLKATGTDPMAGSLQSVADGIAAFGGTDEQLHRVTLGIVQMSGKSVIQMEEMRQQLGESMPNAMRIMARSMGVSVAELTKAISTGRVEAGAALQAFYAELERTYGGEAQRMMETFSGQVTQLKANLQLLATGDGMKGFFEEQKAGLHEINEFLRSGEAKKFAKDIGNALTAMVRGIRIAVKTVYSLREEIALVVRIIAGGMAFKVFGAAAMKMVTSINFARLAIAGMSTQIGSGLSMFRLGAQGLVTMQAAGTSTALVFTGLRTAVLGFGSAIMVAAPWLAAIGAALALAGDKMGWFSKKTDEAYENLKRFGAESKKEALSILGDEEERLRGALADAESDYKWDWSHGRDGNPQKRAAVDAARAELEAFLAERENILKKAGENETENAVYQYQRELNARLREHNEAYRQQQVKDDIWRDNELSRTAETGKKAYQITEEFQQRTLDNRKKRQKEIIATIDAEIARIKDLQVASNSDAQMRELGRLIDFLNGKRVEAAEASRGMDKFGISFVADIESEEDKIKRGGKLLDGLRSSVKGLQAELAGAGNAYAKLQFQIARGDYGSVEEGGQTVRELHQALLDATAQKEALDKLMAGDKKAERDIEQIRIQAMERQLELRQQLANDEMTESEKFQFRLDAGYYDGLGPIENIRAGIMEVVGAVDSQGEALNMVAKTMRENTFGPQTVDRINATTQALDGVLQKVLGINGGLSNTSFAGLGGGSGSYARNGSMFDLIASVESGAAGYNATLDNGRWTGGSKNLVSMTLNEILALQKQMLANPENRALYGNGKGSSALGRYQIVSSTLKGLMKEMGLSGNELYDEKMQDSMAARLLSRRGDSLVGLRQEWAGLKNVPDSVILSALGKSGSGPTRERAAGFNLSPTAGTIPALPTYDVDALVANRQKRTDDLNTRAGDTNRIELDNQLLEAQLAQKKYLDKLLGEISGAGFETDGLGKNFSAAISAIKQGKLGKNRDFEAEEYKEILKAATELDQIERRISERSKAERQAKEQHKTLERERADIAKRIADEQERAKNPDYVGQSNDLRKLIADLDKYVERVGTAYGKTSQEFADAQAYRTQLLGQQRTLDATARQTAIADETRSIRDGLMTRRQLRNEEFRRDMKRIDDWVEAARAAGLSEVDIARQAEEAKAAIRDEYNRATNPVTAQMEQWSDYSGNIMQQTGAWMDNLADGVSGLITGTGDLRGLVNGMLSDVISAQTRFVISQVGGDKAGTAANMVGGKGKTFPSRHTGGIAGVGMRHGVRADPSVFLNAPKFHTGGIAGVPRLKRDELPIIAKKKEGIFTEEQMAALAPVGSESAPITINAPVTVNGSSGTPDQNTDLAKKMAREMESTMRGVVVDEIRRQQRPGNLMNNRRR